MNSTELKLSRLFTLMALRVGVIFAVAIQAANNIAAATPSELSLWYEKPAGQWLEALPVGNGRLGCMVFGGIDVERLQLNEDSLSSGAPQESDNPDALAALPEVRKLLFEGKYNEANALAIKRLICKGAGSKFASAANVPFGCYQTLGDLTLKFDSQGKAAEARPMEGHKQPLLLADRFEGSDTLGWKDYGTATQRKDGRLVGAKGMVTVLDRVNETNLMASVEANSNAEAGIILRFHDPGNYLVALYSPVFKAIYIHDRKNGEWGEQLGSVAVPEIGPKMRLMAAASGDYAAMVMTDGKRTYQTPLVEVSNTGRGKAGLWLYQIGDRQEYGNFELSQTPLFRGGTVVRRPVEYRRTLDLDRAIATVRYRAGDATFTREVFSSASDQVLVVRLTCDQPGRIGFIASLIRPERFTTVGEGSDGLAMSGQLNDGQGGAGGMKYLVRLKAITEAGKVGVTGNSLRVEAANSVTLLLTAGTDYKLQPPSYRGAAPEQSTAGQLKEAAAKSYEELCRAHVADYQKMFHRLALDLGGRDSRSLPTDRRVARLKTKTPDPDLEALLFQYGRYLLISSSRPGDLPINLHGIWADQIQTPWNGSYVVDLNVQMAYWPVETANLSECFLPLMDMVEAWRVAGTKTARVHYNAQGWIVHTVMNVWGFTSPSEHPAFGMYMGAGAWLAQNLWEHYAFTGSREYLERLYPVMKTSAEFYLDWLVKDPKTGKLVSGPSTSPEHEYITHDGQRGWLCMGPSMDQQIIWDLFTNMLEAARAMGIDDDFVRRIRDAKKQLLGPQVGSDGRLMEWAEEFKDSEPGHRHLSHLFGLYPGRQITPRLTPELAAAARKALEYRLANGSTQVGWSSAWTIGLFARLADGDKAHEHIVSMLENLIAPNLMDRVFPNAGFMVDGNFGYTAAVPEMLLQSHAGEIALLPALPKAWPNGSVKGLRARGGVTVDISWRDGKLISARMMADREGEYKVRMPGRLDELTVTLKAGIPLDL